ncbi:MAG: hypothetical protein AB7E55_01150 [Pigmentiphaga sp.]
MSMQPVDQRHPLAGRDALWAAIRRLKAFTVAEVRRETRASKGQAADYVACLLAAGIVERIESERGRYVLVQDRGPVAPRVREDGSAVTQGIGRLRMWRAMKVLGTFTPRELAIHSTLEDHAVAEKEADDYCRHLAHAGYLARRGGSYLFLVSRYTGPKPPMIQRVKQVYDPNIGKVVWSRGGGDD